MDAIKFLTRQHRRVESLFSRYERSPGKAEELFGLIERALVPHAIIEETYVYPMLKERVPGGVTRTEHAIEEHSKIERLLKDMAGMDKRTSEFDANMRFIIDAVSHHVQEEEEEGGLFDLLRNYMTKAELETLGRTLRIASDMTPTRAHPLAPDRPPGNIVVGLPVAVIDRLRDRISGRAEASEAAGEDVTHAQRRGRRAARTRRPASRKRSSTSRSTRGRTTATRGGRKTQRSAASRRRKTGARSQARRTVRAKGKARRR